VKCSNVSLETRSALTKGMSFLCTVKKVKRMSLARARVARQVTGQRMPPEGCRTMLAQTFAKAPKRMKAKEADDI
jgi:hypothetical protein